MVVVWFRFRHENCLFRCRKNVGLWIPLLFLARSVLLCLWTAYPGSLTLTLTTLMPKLNQPNQRKATKQRQSSVSLARKSSGILHNTDIFWFHMGSKPWSLGWRSITDLHPLQGFVPLWNSWYDHLILPQIVYIGGSWKPVSSHIDAQGYLVSLYETLEAWQNVGIWWPLNDSPKEIMEALSHN